ncbi:MAG: UbiX family flavin prenyltransferase [Chthonomonas sp.]|nr:UbiX family flavin prenyltransferase [Chthonomonas sp.]
MSTDNLVVAVTGASGAIYAQRFLRHVTSVYNKVYLMLSDQAIDVAHTELGVAPIRRPFDATGWLGSQPENLILLDHKNYYSPPASGSFQHDGMVIIPCSMGTAGRIANGISDDLVTRSADVCLKEKRPLIVVPREMPWNSIMLRNLTTLSEAGATVLPASPAWYTRPKTLEELADTVVARVLQQLGVPQTLMKPWMVDPE